MNNVCGTVDRSSLSRTSAGSVAALLTSSPTGLYQGIRNTKVFGVRYFVIEAMNIFGLGGIVFVTHKIQVYF